MLEKDISAQEAVSNICLIYLLKANNDKWDMLCFIQLVFLAVT